MDLSPCSHQLGGYYVPISDTSNKIVWQAKSHVESGNIEAVIDPSLRDDYNVQSVWKIAEISIMCVKPYGSQRPSITEVLKEIQGAIEVERGSRLGGDHTMGPQSKNSTDHSMNSNAAGELATPEQNVTFPEFFLGPGLR